MLCLKWSPACSGFLEKGNSNWSVCRKLRCRHSFVPRAKAHGKSILSPSFLLNSAHTNNRVLKILFLFPRFNQNMLTFAVWLLVLLWIWKGRQKAQVFAASVSHLTVLVIRESFCSASEWANITFESMWCLFACFFVFLFFVVVKKKRKKCWRSGYNWGGDRWSQKTQWLIRSHDREVYIGGDFSDPLGIKTWSETGCLWGVGSVLDPLWQSGVSDAVLWKVHRLEITSSEAEIISSVT